jgi:hypothetical protein
MRISGLPFKRRWDPFWIIRKQSWETIGWFSTQANVCFQPKAEIKADDRISLVADFPAGPS